MSLPTAIVLIDKNIPRPVIAFLNDEGVSIVDASMHTLGATDMFLLDWAHREGWCF